MSSQTNISLNSRSMNGIIVISDGSATIENGELNCSNINSSLATITNLTVSNITGDNLTNCTLVNCDVSADPIVNLGIVSKQYADNNFASLTNDNAFTGLLNDFANTTILYSLSCTFAAVFSGSCPQTAITPTLNGHLSRKKYVDDSITSATSGLATTVYVDGQIVLCAKLASANTFSSTNSFTVSCPTASITASGLTDIVNIQYLTKTYGGVYLLKAISGSGNYISFPITTSRTNLTNWTSQPTTSGALTTAQSGTVVGSFSSINVNDLDTLYVVLPLYGLIVYQNSGYTGTIYLNYKNTTTTPVVVAPSTALGGTSVKIYYNDTEQV